MDPSAELEALVGGHQPADPGEAEAKARFLRELRRLPDPLDEDADPVHVTASAVVVGTRGTMLHLHRRLGRWMQPGGHVEPGETPARAARREAQEETGLVLWHPPGGPRFLQLDVHAAAGGHTHLDLRYLLGGPPDDPAPPEGESPQAAWFDWGEAISMADGPLARAIAAARAVWQDEGDAWGRGGADAMTE